MLRKEVLEAFEKSVYEDQELEIEVITMREESNEEFNCNISTFRDGGLLSTATATATLHAWLPYMT